MTTWANVTPNSALWNAGNTLLYLLQETGDYLKHEDDYLILLDQSHIGTWTEDEVASAVWSEKTPSAASWGERSVNSASWTEVIPN